MRMNLKRRHLNQSQVGMVAADALPMLEKEAKKRQGTRTDKLVHNNMHKSNGKHRASAVAGKMFNVSPSYVESAKVIKKDSPKLARAVREGALQGPLHPHRILRTPSKRCDIAQEATIGPEMEPKAHRRVDRPRLALWADLMLAVLWLLLKLLQCPHETTHDHHNRSGCHTDPVCVFRMGTRRASQHRLHRCKVSHAASRRRSEGLARQRITGRRFDVAG